MANRGVPALAIGVSAVVVVTAALFLMLSGTGEKPFPPVDLPAGGVGGVSADAPAAPDVPLVPERPGARVAVETVAAESPRSAGPPESFRRALGLLTGRLVEEDGTPVPDTVVVLFAGQLEDVTPDITAMFDGPPITVQARRGESTTDEDGRFRFAGVFPRAIGALGIDLGGPRATARFVDHVPNPGETVDLGDLALEATVCLTGTVVDPEGGPVAGALVRGTNLPSLLFKFGAAHVRPGISVAWKEWRDDGWRTMLLPDWITELLEILPVPATTTGADGRFTLEAAPVGLVTIIVDQPGFVTAVHGPVPTGQGGGSRDVGRILLDAGDEICGRVVDAAGEPAAGVEVRLGPKIAAGELCLLWSAGETVADGGFRAGGLSDDEHLVAVRAPDALDWKVVAGVFPGMGEPVIRLDPAHDLKVVAVDSKGEIIPRPELLLCLGLDPAEVPVLAPPVRLADRVVYAEDGSATVAALGARQYELFVRAPGYAIARQSIDLTAGGVTERVELAPERSRQVRVVAAGSRDPVAWARVAARRREEWKRGVPVPTTSGRTDANGVCELTGLKDGPWRLRVEHPDFAVTETEVEVPGEITEIDLCRGGTVRGRVHRGGEAPDRPRFLVLEERRTDVIRFAVTDPEGSFRIERVGAGSQRLEAFRRFTSDSPAGLAENMVRDVRSERRLDVEVVEGQESYVDIDLLGTNTEGPVATLRGRVLVNDRPDAGCSISIRPSGQWREGKSTVTDAAGAFDFGRIPAGKIWLTVNRDRSLQAGASYLDGDLSMCFGLAENEVRDLLLEIETGHLRGRVVSDRDGLPVPEANVWATAGERRYSSDQDGTWTSGHTLTEADGSFVFEELPQGTYHLMVATAKYPQATVGPIEVPYGGAPPPVEVRLVSGVSVTGVIRFSGSAAVREFVWLWLQDKGSGQYVEGGEVDPATGRFTIERIAPGSYVAHLGASDGSYRPLELVVPAGGLDGVVLEPQEVVEETDEGGE